MSAERTPGDGQPVSALFASRRIERERNDRSATAERSLMAAYRRLTVPFAVSWERAGDRLREDRLRGLHPPIHRVTVAALAMTPLREMEAAADGAHVIIDGDGGPAVVMVSAEEYDRLRVDKRLLRWEGER